MAQKSSIDQLNRYLRGEISAVETYRMALEKLEPSSPVRGELEACMQSHQSRVMLLQDAIIAAGGTPATSSGPWGVFAKVVEGGARILGDKAAVVALEEGEAHGLKEYNSEVKVSSKNANQPDAITRSLVANRLLPEQQRTHNRIAALKKQLSA